MPLLSPGDAFPELHLALPGSATELVLPDALAGHFGVVLVYRGAWCPYCNAQLASFQRALPKLEEANIQVVALSVDDEAATEKLIADKGLTFPVAHGADPDVVATAVGAFVNPEPRYLQSTGFLLNPSSEVLVSVYSSGAIGRLVPDDVLGMVQYIRSQAH